MLPLQWGSSSVPGPGAKILDATQNGQKKGKERKIESVLGASKPDSHPGSTTFPAEPLDTALTSWRFRAVGGTLGLSVLTWPEGEGDHVMVHATGPGVMPATWQVRHPCPFLSSLFPKSSCYECAGPH